MSLLSVIVPSRNERFLVNTVSDLLRNAAGEIEIIAVLDGYWPDPPLPDDRRIRIVHFSQSRGMRAAVNAGAAVARGQYLMKCDAHCLFAPGFDDVLKANCDTDWVVIPRRKRLDAENWTVEQTSRPDIDYEYLSFPLWKAGEEPGLHGTIWNERIRERFHRPEYDIDDNPAFQGSCWFTPKRFFDETVQGLQEEGFGTFISEPQELGMKAWLSGGAVKINKLTWYAHLHKGKRWGRGYSFDRDDRKAGNAYSCQYWMGDHWPGARYTMEWFVNEKFPNMPYWTQDWQERWQAYSRQSPATILVPNGHKLNGTAPDPAAPEIIMNTFETVCNRFSVTPDIKQIDLELSRADLALLFAELGFTRGAEIGVERGLYSEVLCQSIPGLQLSSIDMWQTYPAYREHVHQDKLDRFYAEAQTRLAVYNTQLIKAFSVDASKQFEDGSLDFVYIDAAHDFLNVTQDLFYWSKKVRKGGLIAGHDFKRSKGDRYTNHVKDVVQAWCYAHSIRPLFICRGDHSPSWFFVKEQ